MFAKLMTDLLITALTGKLGKELVDVVLSSVNAVATNVMYRNDPDKRAVAWSLVKVEVQEAGREAITQFSAASASSINLLMELLVFRAKQYEAKKTVQ
jgi:hypothetical protein